MKTIRTITKDETHNNTYEGKINCVARSWLWPEGASSGTWRLVIVHVKWFLVYLKNRERKMPEKKKKTFFYASMSQLKWFSLDLHTYSYKLKLMMIKKHKLKQRERKISNKFQFQCAAKGKKDVSIAHCGAQGEEWRTDVNNFYSAV